MSNKISVIVLFGGKSTEHEVSCRSASFVVNNIDRSKFDVIPVGIDKNGTWWEQNLEVCLAAAGKGESLVIKKERLSGGHDALLSALLPQLAAEAVPQAVTEKVVVFSVLHGTYGEDGCIQGLFDLNDIAYVGPDRMASSIGMDKVVAKRLVEAAGIPVVPYDVVRKEEWLGSEEAVVERLVKNLPFFPLFVKPASLGSSVGISKVSRKEDLRSAMASAFDVDEKVLIEKGLTVREIEFAAIGGYDPEITVAGEIASPGGFYSYNEKYAQESQTQVMVPAELDDAVMRAGQQLARRVFVALGLHGLTRIDLFLEQKSQQYYFNEVNTLPGFTSISQYPMLCRHAGYTSQQIVEKLIKVAMDRASIRRGLKRSV
jgi:D-alanine-D-alanine ligase